MQSETTKQILLKQPSYTLELVKHWDGDVSRHAFVMHPTVSGYATSHDAEGITLLTGEGHEISRRDVHYALYLFQRFHLNPANSARVGTA